MTSHPKKLHEPTIFTYLGYYDTRLWNPMSSLWHPPPQVLQEPTFVTISWHPMVQLWHLIIYIMIFDPQITSRINRVHLYMTPRDELMTHRIQHHDISQPNYSRSQHFHNNVTTSCGRTYDTPCPAYDFPHPNYLGSNIFHILIMTSFDPIMTVRVHL